MSQAILYQIALTMVPGIGCVQARNLLEHFTAEEIFKAKKSTLEKVNGVGTLRATAIKSFTDFSRVEKEIAFIEKYRITTFFITDPNYPKRLLNCYDAPAMLYYRGNTLLNHSKIIAVVGSRNHTDYGKHLTEALIKNLENADVVVVSGLAYGIDSVAHKACVKHNVPTLGVLAHGLDKIYPPAHTELAKEMLYNGGLLTEFVSKTKPDRHNFPSRNRIVAGLSDAVIVVETDIKGGSMITAELANGYNKDVFAYPGKTTDKKSSGCNLLIKTNNAVLLTNVQQLLETMGWSETPKPAKKKTKELFITLTNDEKIIVDLINKNEQLAIDEINLKSGLSSSAVAVAILNLELQNVVLGLPGKMYRML